MFKVIMLFVLMFFFFNLSAQKEHNIKVKIEAGLLEDLSNDRVYLSGAFLRVEPKVKTSKNTFLGLRIGYSVNSQKIIISNPNQFYIDYTFDNTNKSFGHLGNRAVSFVPTFDYYFIKNNIRPYLGLGIGYYFLTNSRGFLDRANPFDTFEVSVNNQVGFLLRGGLEFNKLIVGRFDLSKFSVGFEFNYIPKTDVEIPNGQVLGTVANSYLGLSIGYTIGIGKD